MTLANGAELGPYKILSMIGKGGMGEVYLARDTRLDRDVAVKVSVAQFTERFEREARTAAQLNHPNVCTLYDIALSPEGFGYLVMEFVEGDTLADRIQTGPVPLDEALRLAYQIIDGVEAAHEKGIVHRDLKPANIKIKPDGSVKILDFGLAKQGPASGDSGAVSADSPTLTMGMTVAGMVLGTAAYMAPEQAKGKTVDKRADIWAFGVVLHEMLTGQRLFQQSDMGETLAAVIMKEPDIAAAPERVHRLLRRCLERDPRKRLRDIGDARILLEETPAVTPGLSAAIGPPSWRARLGLAASVAAGVLAVAAGVLGLGWWRAARPVARPLIRMSVDLGAEAVLGEHSTVAISADATRIAFPVRTADGKIQLATRLLNQATPTVLAGTDNAVEPFFSPDGQWIGFFADAKMKKISVLGGAAIVLCDASTEARGASWADDGSIVASLAISTGLSRVPADGGAPQTLTRPEARGEATHRWPQVLPGGKAVLFLGNNVTTAYENASIEVLSLKTGQTKTLLRGGYFPRYLPASASRGYLIYLHEGVLFGVPFDVNLLELRGSPVPLLEDVASDVSTGAGQYDVSGAASGSGILVNFGGKTNLVTLEWLESGGKTQPLLAKPGLYAYPRVAPDGTRLALTVVAGSGQDLFVYDWRHDTMPRLTFSAKANEDPVWTRDGKYIAYDTTDALWWIRADGGGEPQKLLEGRNVTADSFTPDGKGLAYESEDAVTHSDIWILPLDLSDPEHPKAGKPEAFLRTPASELSADFSPDGRWVAYTSDESGAREVFVRPFPGPGGKWQISTGGGQVATWSLNGRELFYVTPDNRMMVTEYTAKGDSFSYAKPRQWSDKRLSGYGGARVYDLAPDGRRLVALRIPEAVEVKQGNLHANFLLNFFDDVRRRIPLN